ncbi:UNVERIFIED_CONTAM: hypothetical protein Slati_3499000 [Sesamum latifolium]|uniref:G-patch domain-containing protein n=1 Tax=Sesamum latifolium TaxID=2727402 RepID=A0AAW2UKZ4_9LAMI
MELSMIASGVEGPPIQELRSTKEKQEIKKGGKPFSKNPSTESMALNVAPFKLKGIAKDSIAPKNNVPYEKPQRKLTLKEMQARQYPFLDSDIPGIFDDLLEANLIDLPEMKRPEEAERKDDPKYCKYHRLVGHTIQDCFVFKDKINAVGSPSKPFTEVESHFVDAKYYIEGTKKEKEVLPSEEPKSLYLKQSSKPPLKGFVPSTQEEEGGHEALAIDEKGFDPKAFKLLVKAGYNPKEKSCLGKLPPEATGKMLHGLNTTK